jgi:hypothetical protein
MAMDAMRFRMDAAAYAMRTRLVLAFSTKSLAGA